MRTLAVTFDGVSVSNPDKSSKVVRYYKDVPETILDIIHDYLKIYFKLTEFDIGYLNIKISPDKGYFSKDSMDRIRNIIVDRILSEADGEIPLTNLQKSLLFDRLNSGRPTKR